MAYSIDKIRKIMKNLRAGKTAQTDEEAREVLAVAERGLYEGSLPASICDDYIAAYEAAPKTIPLTEEDTENQLLEELGTQLLIKAGFYK